MIKKMKKSIKQQVLDVYVDVYGNDFKDVREFEKEDMKAIIDLTIAKICEEIEGLKKDIKRVYCLEWLNEDDECNYKEGCESCKKIDSIFLKKIKGET